MQSDSQRNDQILAGCNERTRRHDEAAIGFFCECGEGRLDVCCIAHASCCHFHPQRAGSCFGRVHKRDMGGYFRTVDERYSPHLRRDLLKHFQPFPADRGLKILEAGDISAGMRQVRHETTPNRI